MAIPRPTSQRQQRHNCRSAASWRRTNTAALLLLSLVRPVISTIGDAGFGYTPTTDVTQVLNLALDIKDMRAADAASNFDQAVNIYQQGQNALPLTLADLSLTAGEQWSHHALFNLYRYGFEWLGQDNEQDAPGNFDGSPAPQYANQLVLDLFDLKLKNIAPDAVIAHSVAMAYWGHLADMLDACIVRDYDKMHTQLDTAAALYVGAEQEPGDDQIGFMLYQLAEYTASKFGQEEAVSAVNQEVLSIWNALQTDINNSICSQGESGYLQVRAKVQRLVQLTNTVLVQMLLHHVAQAETLERSDFAELYALAILPQILPCDTALYDDMLNLLVANNVTDNQKSDIVSAIQSSYSCLHIKCSQVGAYEGDLIPGCSDDVGFPKLVGYQTASDVFNQTYLDRDLRQMEIQMNFGAFDAAKDFYMYGWNAGTLTLHKLAIAKPPVPSPEYSRYTAFASLPTDTMILNALTGTGIFGTASLEQRSEVVMSLIETNLLYLAVTNQLSAAVSSCNGGDTAGARMHWDSAVAFYVGSGEGTEDGGYDGGTLLYALSDELCDDFDTCGDVTSDANEMIIDAFTSGASALENKSCATLKNVAEYSIKPNMLVTLIQGTLLYTVESYEENMDANGQVFSDVFAFSRAILPEINANSTDSASIINSNTNFFIDTPSVVINEVFGAVMTALPNMTVPCVSVGKVITNKGTLGVCSGDIDLPSTPVATSPPTLSPVSTPAVPSPSTEDILGWGRYRFVNETVAYGDANFSYDVKAMSQASSVAVAHSIYNSTSTHVLNGFSGFPQVKSLKGLGGYAFKYMANDYMYNIYRLAFYRDDEIDEDEFTAAGWPFADQVVELAGDALHGNSEELSAKAAVLLEIALAITHQLYEAVRQCRDGQRPAELVDSAFGLWIGRGQTQGKTDGWMLYADAQEAWRNYGQSEKEAKVNTELMGYFNAAQLHAKSCPFDPTKAESMQIVVDAMIKKLYVSIVQNMLYYMSEDYLKYVELYALAFIPQAIGCDEPGYGYLRDSLFESFNFETSIDDNLLYYLGKTFKCLRYTCEDLGNTTNASANLKELVNDLCDQINVEFDPTLMAGFATDQDVSELARIDLDLQQVYLMMRAQAYDAASDIYAYGRNSLYPSGGLRSLQDLALDEGLQDENVAGVYLQYYSSSTHADDLIKTTINYREDGQFAGADRRQRAEAVFRLIQTEVIFPQVMLRLRQAVDTCTSNANVTVGQDLSQDNGQGSVDEAIALFVGSMEGPLSGGSDDGSGVMTFALAKELCADFGKCESHGDAIVNEFLMFALSDLKEALDAGNCTYAIDILEGSIAVMLPVPLIQGTLLYAAWNQHLTVGDNDDALATGAVFADSFAPFIYEVNETSAKVVTDNMEFSLTQQPVRDGATAVLDAIGSVLDDLYIDCDNIGNLVNYSGLSMCNATRYAPPNTTASHLGDDLYVASTYVQDKANIALDVATMIKALSNGNKNIAQLIYLEGENSEVYDSEGIKLSTRSLAEFSINASATMTENPLYYITVYALRGSNGAYMGASADRYADSVVGEAFKLPSGSTVAAEAAVALNLWMVVANELFRTVAMCRLRTLTGTSGVHGIDSAVAYWIGDGQTAADSDAGHSLYGLAERMAGNFAVDQSGQSQINTNILTFFHQAQLELSQANACSDNPKTAPRLRSIVNKIASQMIVVNTQALIHYLRTSDRDRVRVYAHSIVPLISACNPSTFAYLKSKLIDDSSYPESEVDDIVAAIRSAFPCFGVSCQQVGIHKTETSSVCSGSDQVLPMAGFKTQSDMSEYTQLDLDVLELDILMAMKAYGPAEELYRFGKHATPIDSSGDGTTLSLQSLATSPGRTAVPQFDSFRRYFQTANYADGIVMDAISGSSTTDPVKRRFVVTEATRVMVTYMSVLEWMHNTVTSCESQDSSSEGYVAVEDWDMAASYLIGSLEGSKDDSQDGIFLWGLSKDYCDEFETCSQQVEGASDVDQRMLDLLYSGRGAILSGSCDALRKATTEMAPTLLVPIIQAALSVATQLKHKTGNKSQLQAQGYVYASALLPLIKDQDLTAAERIQSNFPLDGQAVHDPLEKVAKAFADSMNGLQVNCHDVGRSSDVNACTGDSSKGVDNVGAISGIVIGGVAFVGIIFLLFAKRKAKKEEPANFVVSTGELNHTTELLQKRDSSQVMTAAETDKLYDADETASDEDEMYLDAVQRSRKDSTLQVV